MIPKVTNRVSKLHKDIQEETQLTLTPIQACYSGGDSWKGKWFAQVSKHVGENTLESRPPVSQAASFPPKTLTPQPQKVALSANISHMGTCPEQL